MSLARRSLSVALLTGDSEAVLRPMLASLVAQSRPADEVVIHDGGSTDGTIGLIRSFESLLPITVVRSPSRRSVGASRSLAIAASSGELIAVADHDDVFLPDHLAVCEAALPADGTVVTPTALLWTPGRGVRPMSDLWDVDLPPVESQLDALVGQNVITAMTVFTRADYDRHGPYRDESFVEDWDLWIRMALAGIGFVRPQVPTLLYRWGHANVSSDHVKVAAAEEMLIERHRAALEAAIGSTRYRRALDRRHRRTTWITTYEHLCAGRDAEARRLARRSLRLRDPRLIAAALLPTPLVRRRLGLGRPAVDTRPAT